MMYGPLQDLASVIAALPGEKSSIPGRFRSKIHTVDENCETTVPVDLSQTLCMGHYYFDVITRVGRATQTDDKRNTINSVVEFFFYSFFFFCFFLPNGTASSSYTGTSCYKNPCALRVRSRSSVIVTPRSADPGSGRVSVRPRERCNGRDAKRNEGTRIKTTTAE